MNPAFFWKLPVPNVSILNRRAVAASAEEMTDPGRVELEALLVLAH